MKTTFTSLIFGMTLLFSTSCLQQGELPKIPGVDGPKINVKNGKLLVSIGLENLNLPVGYSGPISKDKLKGSELTISPSLEGGTLLKASFDIGDVESSYFEVVPANLLPNGEPFPFTADGELPAHAFYVEKAAKATFYASKKLFGVFIPVKLGDNVTFDIPFTLKINGKRVGIVSAIGNNAAGEGSGIVVMLSLKDIEANDDLQKALKYSKKSKYQDQVF